MKASELMIGNWVIVYEKAMPVKARVEGVFGRGAMVLGHVRSADHGFMEPIPLTPEILEKNGFAIDEIAGWRLRQYEEGLGLIYEIYWNDKGAYLEIISNLAKIGEFNKNGIQFVHQLQNALRLCGIEKEIEL